MAKILIVEDDEAMSDMLAGLLAVNKHVVEQVYDGDAGLDRVRNYQYDLVLVDWQLPELSGVELCREIKKRHPNLPLLMLTSKNRIQDKAEGFDSGADDYLTKPIDRQEFAARVRALLRRSSAEQEKSLVHKDLVLDPDSGRCTRSGRPIALARKEADLLELLMRQQDDHVTTEAIVARLWGEEGSRAGLANCLKRLRKKLNEAGEPDLIETVAGSGYRIN